MVGRDTPEGRQIENEFFRQLGAARVWNDEDSGLQIRDALWRFAAVAESSGNEPPPKATYPQVQILDKGFVRLDDFIMDDLSVINSARVSYGKRVDVVTEADRGLIKYLMNNRHGTPFEHNAVRFHVKAPIFVFREWHRHRIGSFNEMSARYMELPADWYIPDLANVRVRVGKPGHYKYERAPLDTAVEYVHQLQDRCASDYREYKTQLEEGIAPELARLLLHVNHYSEMYWTVNARSLMNFINLRSAETAQWEIRQYSIEIEGVWAALMPYTYDAFVNNNRIAP